LIQSKQIAVTSNIRGAELNHPIAKVAFLVIWSSFTYWTIRTFWIRRAEAIQNWMEVRLFGVALTLTIAVTFSLLLSLPAFSFWQSICFWIAMGFPISMWCAYFSIRTIHLMIVKNGALISDVLQRAAPR
jgi:hypothetical protein